MKNTNPTSGWRASLLSELMSAPAGLQDDLKDKMEELQSKSDTVASLGERYRTPLSCL